MTIYLNERELTINNFAVNNGMNFGRFDDLESKQYQIKLSKKEIENLIEIEYHKIRNVVKTDDLKFNETSEFTSSNYCTLAELFQYEDDFEEIMKTYLDRILYNKIFPFTSNNRYVINSTDTIKFVDGHVIFYGRVFEKKS